jgi:hypothetical protein
MSKAFKDEYKRVRKYQEYHLITYAFLYVAGYATRTTPVFLGALVFAILHCLKKMQHPPRKFHKELGKPLFVKWFLNTFSALFLVTIAFFTIPEYAIDMLMDHGADSYKDYMRAFFVTLMVLIALENLIATRGRNHYGYALGKKKKGHNFLRWFVRTMAILSVTFAVWGNVIPDESDWTRYLCLILAAIACFFKFVEECLFIGKWKRFRRDNVDPLNRLQGLNDQERTRVHNLNKRYRLVWYCVFLNLATKLLLLAFAIVNFIQKEDGLGFRDDNIANWVAKFLFILYVILAILDLKFSKREQRKLLKPKLVQVRTRLVVVPVVTNPNQS